MEKVKRINYLVSNIRKNCNLYYDIGCDHGKIGLELLKQSATVKVVFCDLSQINLNKAKLLIKSNKFLSRANFVVADGVPKNAKNGIGLIFGLGGETIIHILEQNKGLTEFYLQPNSSIISLRQYLDFSKYEIKEDFVFCDGKSFYTFMHIVINEAKKHLNEDEILLGHGNLNRKDVVFMEYLEKELQYLTKALAKIGDNMLQLNVDNKKIELFKRRKTLIARFLKGE